MKRTYHKVRTAFIQLTDTNICCTGKADFFLCNQAWFSPTLPWRGNKKMNSFLFFTAITFVALEYFLGRKCFEIPVPGSYSSSVEVLLFSDTFTKVKQRCSYELCHYKHQYSLTFNLILSEFCISSEKSQMFDFFLKLFLIQWDYRYVLIPYHMDSLTGAGTTSFFWISIFFANVKIENTE